MTIGAPIRLLLLLVILSATSVTVGETAIDAVFTQLSSQPPQDIRYTEKKYSGFLDDAINLSGTLRYRAPDTIIREQTSPEQLRFEITGNVVNMLRKGKNTSIKLDTVPSLKIFINSFRAILYGDLNKLKSYYKITFSGSVASWRITLQPRDTLLGLAIETIQFTGTQGFIKKIVIRENEEDWSEMILEPLKITTDHGKH